MSTLKNINIIEDSVNDVRKSINKYDSDVNLLSNIQILAEHIKEPGSSYLPIIVYKSTNGEMPNPPVGGKWSYEAGAFYPPEG